MQSFDSLRKNIYGRQYGATFNARTLSTVSAIALAASAFAVPHPVFAAAPAQEAQAPLEEIVITGSRIVREGYEAPTPLAVVTTEALQSSAAANVADFVNTMPSFAGSATPTSGAQSVSAGTAGVNLLNLRSLGTSRTLVLVDGQRSVASILASNGVDINTFPQQLVSRVEVVTGGASAVYGSDAVGGVVNFILDKTFTGVKGEVSGGMTKYRDDKNYKVALSAGFPFANDRGHVLLSGLQSYEQGVIPGSGGKGVRDWNSNGWHMVATPGYSATTGAGGKPEYNIMSHVGIWTAAPGGIITNGPLKGLAFGQSGTPYIYQMGNFTDARYTNSPDWYAHDIREDHGENLAPEQSNQSVFLRAAYDVTDNFNVFAQFNWAHNNTYDFCCAQFQIASVTIKGDNAFLQQLLTPAQKALITPTTSMTLGSFNYDLPADQADNDRLLGRYVVGGSGKIDAFATSWSWNAYFQKGISKNSQKVPGVFSRAAIARAGDVVIDPTGKIVCRSTLTNPNDGCKPYNYFGIGVNTAAAINYVTGVSQLNQTIKQDVWSASATGEPVSLWAGPVSVALSVEHRTEAVSGESDAGSKISDHLSGNSRPTIGSYNVTEGAVETLIPLANGKPWADNWDLSAAVRATSYSTSGYVTTWKVGSTYSAIPDVKLRVTRSRDIRAPNLAELYAGGTAGSGATLDPFPNALQPNPTVLALTVGNPNLQPEKGDTTGIGVVVQPSFVPGLSFSVDYWNIKMTGQIQAVSRQNQVDICKKFLIDNVPNPGAQAFCDGIIRTSTGAAAGTGGAVVVALTAPGVLYQTTSRPTNYVANTTRGLDFEGSYRVRLDELQDSLSGNLGLHVLATHYLKAYTNDGFNAPTEVVGENSGGAPPKWRYNATLTYDLAPVRASLTARGVSSGTWSNAFIQCTSGCPLSTPDHRTIDNNQLPGYLYWDTSISYNVGLGDSAEGELFFNIKNILNTDPGIVPRQVTGNNFFEPATNLSLYDVLGRVFRAGVRFKM